MDRITDTLKDTLIRYTGKGIGCWLFPLFDDLHQTYGVVGIDYPSREDSAGVTLFARVLGDQVVIEEDRTDKKLVEALLQAGIPREQIILAYEGEVVKDDESSLLYVS